MPDLLEGIHKALGSLDPIELKVMSAAMLHGVPLSQLASDAWPQEKLQTLQLGALRKLRKALTDQGLSSAEIIRQIQG